MHGKSLANCLGDPGTHFGIGESAVRQNSRHFAHTVDKDSGLRSTTEHVKRGLNLSSV